MSISDAEHYYAQLGEKDAADAAEQLSEIDQLKQKLEMEEQVSLSYEILNELLGEELKEARDENMRLKLEVVTLTQKLTSKD